MKAASLWCPFESTGTVRYGMTIATITKKDEMEEATEKSLKEEHRGGQLQAESSDSQ